MVADRAILSVVGAHSGSGKTTFVGHLLRHVRGLAALKISPARDWPAGDAAKGRTVGKDYYLEAPADLHRPGKDTTLYLEAGAIHVERLRHRGAGLAAGLDAALRRCPAGVPVVVESSRAVVLLKPVAVVLVVRPPLEEMKPATQAILPQVTDLLINSPTRQQRSAGRAVHAEANSTLCRGLQQQFASLRPQFTWSADLITGPPPQEMLDRLATLLHKHRHP